MIISAGQLVSDALDCAEVLSKQGISVEVIDMFCIKPLDEGSLSIREAAGKRAVVTFENHSIIGGLGKCCRRGSCGRTISLRSSNDMVLKNASAQ